MVYSTGRLVFSLALCYFVLVFFSPFSIAITSLGEERANLSVSLFFFVRLFDLRLFGFVCFLFLLVSWRAAACDCGTPWTFLLPFVKLIGCLDKFRKERSVGSKNDVATLFLFQTWYIHTGIFCNSRVTK